MDPTQNWSREAMSGLVPQSQPTSEGKDETFEMQVIANIDQPFEFFDILWIKEEMISTYSKLLVAVHAALHDPVGNGESNRSLFLPRHRGRRVPCSQNNTVGQGASDQNRQPIYWLSPYRKILICRHVDCLLIARLSPIKILKSHSPSTPLLFHFHSFNFEYDWTNGSSIDTSVVFR